MTASPHMKRLVVGVASAGLLAGGSLLGLSGTASAAPTAAPSTVPSTLTGDRDHDRDRDNRHDRHDRWEHDRCTWVKGHWATDKGNKGHWERTWHPGSWHHGYRDHHGNWHDGWWSKGYWKQHWVPGHSVNHWVPGHWNCHDKW
ncbi:hypothetical protein K7B06_34340 [Streptomyces erythrochromogenes]|nr:hypothetical protein [Streptomyces erythrochromogenes]